MKALLMLDHVMLWIARAFAVYLLAICLGQIWRENTGWVSLPIALIRLVCVIDYCRPISRIFLTASTILAMIITPLSLYFLMRSFEDLSLPTYPFLMHLVPKLALYFLGCVALLWTAIRASDSIKIGGVSPHPPIPQSC